MSADQPRKTEEGRHRGLGRGLSALIGEEAADARRSAGRGSRTVPVAFLKPNRFQPRKTFSPDELNDLANSISEKGVLQPILVRPIKGEADAFEIVAGERRWRAAQLAKLHDVPVVVRELSDGESLELAIIENVQRADLNAIEEAAAYRELMDRFAYTQERVAQEVGKSRSHVANTLRLLKLPESVQVMIRDGATQRRPRADPDRRKPTQRRWRAKSLPQRSMFARPNSVRKPKSAKPHQRHEKDPDTKALEANLSNVLGLKVEILDKGKAGGQVRIFYRTLEQLDDICSRLNRNG